MKKWPNSSPSKWIAMAAILYLSDHLNRGRHAECGGRYRLITAHNWSVAHVPHGTNRRISVFEMKNLRTCDAHPHHFLEKRLLLAKQFEISKRIQKRPFFFLLSSPTQPLKTSFFFFCVIYEFLRRRHVCRVGSGNSITFKKTFTFFHSTGLNSTPVWPRKSSANQFVAIVYYFFIIDDEL